MELKHIVTAPHRESLKIRNKCITSVGYRAYYGLTVPLEYGTERPSSVVRLLIREVSKLKRGRGYVT